MNENPFELKPLEAPVLSSILQEFLDALEQSVLTGIPLLVKKPRSAYREFWDKDKLNRSGESK